MDEQTLVTGGQTGLIEGDTVVTQDGQEFVKEGEALVPVTEAHKHGDKLEKPKGMTCKQWREIKATGVVRHVFTPEPGKPFALRDGAEYNTLADGSIRRRK